MNGTTPPTPIPGPGVGSPMLEQVREGMSVVDAAGEHLGTVDYVRMGDPAAASLRGNELPRLGLVGQLGAAVFGDEREPDVRGAKRSQLLRCGFLKVDGPGLFDDDRYVRGDLVTSVQGTTVTLGVRKDQLPAES